MTCPLPTLRHIGVEGEKPFSQSQREPSINESPQQLGTGLCCPHVQIPANRTKGLLQAWGTCTAQETRRRCHPSAINPEESLGGKVMRKERRQWAPGQSCFMRSGRMALQLGVEDIKTRRAELPRLKDGPGREPGTGQTSCTHQVPLVTKEPQHNPGKPQESHGRSTKSSTDWGRGLVPDTAGGSSRKEHVFKHSLYLAQWPGQTASQMQTVGSRCNGLTKLGKKYHRD